jgi:hypothetical protein
VPCIRPGPGSAIGVTGASLQLPLQLVRRQNGSTEPFASIGSDAYIRSSRFRPRRFLAYEHMFSLARTSKLAQRALDAVRLTRSFLLLEDDYEVDWEVGQDEPQAYEHPHRVPLRGGLPRRRPGAPAPRNHVCLCPVRNPGASRGGSRQVPSAAERSSSEKATRV